MSNTWDLNEDSMSHKLHTANKISLKFREHPFLSEDSYVQNHQTSIFHNLESRNYQNINYHQLTKSMYTSSIFKAESYAYMPFIPLILGKEYVYNMSNFLRS